MSTEAIIELDHALANDVVVGLGQFQIISGKLHWPGHHGLRLQIETLSDRSCQIELFSNDQKDLIEFFISIPWLTKDIGQCFDIIIKVSDHTHASTSINLGSVYLLEAKQQGTSSIATLGDKPLVAICMATYSPNIKTFARQLETILCQTYENWCLIICDDASPDADWQEIEALCQHDRRRIRLIRNKQNVGFYHNFERALSHVPDNAALVAFADQDDIWYPDKLHKLIEKLHADNASLVYSDMRIVHEQGEVVAETYWQGRKNEYRDFDTVFLANTVTGAASLFERKLLNTLLPFPEKIGDAFHDHWLACTALNIGKISYVDQPLYDYIQYGNSVIGHCDFVRWSATDRLKSLAKLGLRLLKPASAKTWIGQKLGGGMAIYRGECLRLKIIADTLKLRSSKNKAHPTLNLMNGGLASAFKLLKTHIKILRTGRTTDDAEFRLAMGFVARKYQKWRG